MTRHWIEIFAFGCRAHCSQAQAALSIVVLVGLVVSAGCRDEVAKTESTDPMIAVATPVQRPEPVHSVVAESGFSESPAAESQRIDPATLTPEKVCGAFIERLQIDDRVGAENLLTRAAFTTTRQANLRLEPICSSVATIRVLPATYSSHLHRMAEVECLVTDTVDGKIVELPITWQVTRQPNGWRVSGMAVRLDEAGNERLLSFESIDDVATLKVLAAGDAISETQSLRQADADRSKTKLQ